MIGISFYNAYWFDTQALSLWDDRATLARWLEVERTLARVQATLGIIPETAAARIEQVAQPDQFDLTQLADAIARAQHPLVPVLKRIEELAGDDSGGWLHWGATTQNIFDTAQALQLAATVKLVHRHLDHACARLAQDAHRHRHTAQAGRTHGQHALPITYGFKLAGWLAELRRHGERLTNAAERGCVARISGAVGTYAALDGRGREVEEALAAALGLAIPDLAGRADFDRQAEILTNLAACAAGAERIAADLLFLQRTEIAEVAEDHYADRVGSSTMAQKRNPSEAQRVIALARLTRGRVPMVLEAMVRQDEGDAASTNVTDVLMPDFCVLAASTIAALARLLDHAQPDPARMRANLDMTGGMICAEAVMMQLGRVLGRGEAHHILHETAARSHQSGQSFADSVRHHPRLADHQNTIDLDALLDPTRYLGEVDAIVDRITGQG